MRQGVLPLRSPALRLGPKGVPEGGKGLEDLRHRQPRGLTDACSARIRVMFKGETEDSYDAKTNAAQRRRDDRSLAVRLGGVVHGEGSVVIEGSPNRPEGEGISLLAARHKPRAVKSDVL